ncbi:Zn-dependent hydrolase (plasmid) [Haloferax prahovense]|uniref:Zn-dependent hydrolase n=1 Tax=Haloferax prahovense TaxID=381852 RepID=UPI003C760224
MVELIHQYVDESRLRKDIEYTAGFGALSDCKGNGRTVLTGTDANRDARQYFVDRLEDAGFGVRVDAVGNIAGRWEPNGIDSDADPVAVGSHLDSVVEGGIFDGVLGVYAGLESVRAMQDAGMRPTHPIEVVAFTEEEGGRFSDGVLGSSVASGNTAPDTALAIEDDTGVTLAEALEQIGFRGSGVVDALAWDTWLELHIEQGTRLEATGVPVGIVTSITGTVRSHVNIVGEADHAGATSMQNRRDALAAASELTLAVESIANDVVSTTSETAVATVGQHTVKPNSINVIPGQVHLGIDIRDVETDAIDEIVRRIRSRIDHIEAEREVCITYSQEYEIEPSKMSSRCIEETEAAAARVGTETLKLHSGAGHDTMQLTDVTDVGMLFAPSIDGVSHSPLERTTWADCTEGTKVLCQTLGKLARSS